MRKADNTIVFGSQNPSAPLSAGPSSLTPPASVPPHRLADDLVDERPAYMQRPERGVIFAGVSLALIGVAAAGTWFLLRSPVEPVSTTSTTSAEVTPADPTPASPTPAPNATPPSPPDQPWDKPEVDAVRSPTLSGLNKANSRPTELPGTQVAPTARPQPVDALPNAAPTANAAKIQGSSPTPVATAKRVTQTTTTVTAPPAGMSDEALERAGFYRGLTPKPAVTTGEPEAPRTPSAAATETPSSFTPPPPPPSEAMPDVQIKE